METAIASLLCIALIAFGGMTMSRGFMTSVDNSAVGLKESGYQNEMIMRTEITPQSTAVAGDIVEITLDNTGQTRLADFDRWDVIMQYYDSSGLYHITWLPYNSGTLGDNEWQVAWIHYNDIPEVFEPNVLNPKEQMKIKARLNPPVGAGTTNMAVVSTPSGITGSIYFSP